MKLSDFKARIRLACPNLGDGVSSTYLTLLTNKGCNETNKLCKVYKGHTDFNIEAGKSIYELSEIAPLFLGRDPRGVWLKDSNDEWKQITIKSEEYISHKFPNYLNADSVEMPSYCWVDGNNLGFFPPPSTAYTAGGRIYHLLKAVDMANDDHYPFSGSEIELTVFEPLDEAIIAWVEWKLKPNFGANTDIDLGYRRFIEACRIAKRQIKNAPDYSRSPQNTMSIG